MPTDRQAISPGTYEKNCNVPRDDRRTSSDNTEPGAARLVSAIFDIYQGNSFSGNTEKKILCSRALVPFTDV